MQRVPEHNGCIGDYLAHESVMGNLCSGKLSPILIRSAAPNKQNVSSFSTFREYAAHLYGTLRHSGVDGEEWHPVRAKNDLLQSVSTTHKPRSACITVSVARLSQILAALFRVPSTPRENEGRAVLYSSDPALAGLKDRI